MHRARADSSRLRREESSRGCLCPRERDEWNMRRVRAPLHRARSRQSTRPTHASEEPALCRPDGQRPRRDRWRSARQPARQSGRPETPQALRPRRMPATMQLGRFAQVLLQWVPRLISAEIPEGRKHCEMDDSDTLPAPRTYPERPSKAPRHPPRFRDSLDSRHLLFYSRHVRSMPYGKQHKHTTRSLSRRPRDDDPRVAPPPACPRLRLGPAHPAALQQPASGRRRFALPRPPAPAQGKARPRRLGCVALDQPPRAHLRNHQNRHAPPRARDLKLRPHARGRPDGARARPPRREFLKGNAAMSWIERVFRRRRLNDELGEEMREHIEQKTEQLMRLENLSRAEARLAALRAFGNPSLIETRSREVWQWPTLESLLADLRLALRRLAKSPGFAVTVLLTLAIGIGANTAVFSVVNSVLLKPLPYPEPEQLVAVWLHAPGAAGLANFSEGLRLSPSMYLTFAEHNRTFQSIGVWVSGTANVTGIAQPEEVHATYISDGVLQTFNVSPAVGRWILPADQVPNSHRVVMMSYGYWQRRFGGDTSVVGRNIEVDSQAREIVGVMPRGFEVVNQDFDMLIPLAFDPLHQILAGFGYNGIARLKPGVTINEADADIARMLDIWMDSWTNGPDGGDPHFYRIWKISGAIRPMKQEVIGSVGSVLWAVMGTIAIVMLIACANVANLLLVRVEARRQELAVRAALGASRARIAGEVLGECVLLALIGGAAGIAIAEAGLSLLVRIGPANLPRLNEISLDARSIAFTVGLSLVSALLFGSIAALKSMRPTASLAQASASRTASTSRERQRGRHLLVVAQVAMAMALLVSAALMIRTLAALRRVDPGFADADHVQTLRIAIPRQLVSDEQAAMRMENNIVDKLAAIPG